MDDSYKDPSQLTDEELDAAIEGKEIEGQPEKEQDSPDEPETEVPEKDDESEDEPEKADDSENEQDSEPEEDEAQEDEAEKPEKEDKPSPRQAKRIQQLLEKTKRQRTVEQPAPVASQPVEVQPINFRELIDAPDEVFAQLESAVEEYGKQFTQPAPQPQQTSDAQFDTLRWETNLKIDTPKVLSKFSKINPDDKENFDPIVADSLNQEYLQTVGFDERTGLVANPNISYSDFIEARFELANLLADEKTETTKKNVVKQAAATGLRPDGSQSKRLNLNQAAENMTDEELDAIIAQGIPPR